MLLLVAITFFSIFFERSESFVVRPASISFPRRAICSDQELARRSPLFLSSEQPASDATEEYADVDALSKEEKEKAVGNLVADDEWQGLTMELSELVRLAIVEDLKKNTRDFLGKDDYKMGDISKEVDSRVKDEVAKLRGKEEYELGDFVLAMDEVSKSLTEQLTGKDYEPGDLSKEIDRRIKEKVVEFAGKEDGTYEFGDLSREIDRRVKKRVEEFTGKGEYKFGDISATVEERRKEWVKDFLGEEAANNYAFGDITKKALANFTGKDDYQFGDITKRALSNLFGKRKTKGSDSDQV